MKKKARNRIYWCVHLLSFDFFFFSDWATPFDRRMPCIGMYGGIGFVFWSGDVYFKCAGRKFWDSVEGIMMACADEFDGFTVWFECVAGSIDDWSSSTSSFALWDEKQTKWLENCMYSGCSMKILIIPWRWFIEMLFSWPRWRYIVTCFDGRSCTQRIHRIRIAIFVAME